MLFRSPRPCPWGRPSPAPGLLQEPKSRQQRSHGCNWPSGKNQLKQRKEMEQPWCTSGAGRALMASAPPGGLRLGAAGSGCQSTRLARRWRFGHLREVRHELEAGVLRRLVLKVLQEELGDRQPGEARIKTEMKSNIKIIVPGVADCCGGRAPRQTPSRPPPGHRRWRWQAGPPPPRA